MEPIRIDPEFKALIPPLTDEEYSQLEANILRDGILDAVKVWRGEWILLDGHNRLEIAKKHGLEYEITEVDCADRDAAMDWIDRNQLGRRNLKPDQRHLLMGRCYNRTKRHDGGHGNQKSGGQNVPPVNQAERLADEFGVDPKTVKRAGQFAEAVEKTKAVDKSIEKKVVAGVAPPRAAIVKAAALLEKAPEKAKAILNGDAKLTEVLRQEKAEEITKKASLPDAKYRVIYADPPWSYGNTMPEGSTEPRDYYPVMSLAEICALPISGITEDNAVLFLWATSPILEEAFEVVKAWGFKYKSSFVWDKIKHNMGHYNSVRHEFLLICVKGSCQPEVRKLFDSVVSEERTEHSKKPETFRAIIDTLYPSGKRVELFARTKVEGWDVYGNEA
jgi:N6-adenosine-specific RNA methylase IME4/ParB-like chromosome segregation protein Spo0J